jgi:Spy/CpxP family protein refolding chaperone
MTCIPSTFTGCNMNTIQNKSLRILAAIAVGAVLTGGLVSTASAAPDNGQKMEHDWARHRQEQMKARLAKASERLGIQPAQQNAWQAYADAVERPVGGFHKDPNAPTDAASIARRRADIAADHAAKQVKIAEATSALQTVLTPEQRQKFDQMVKHADRHGHRGWPHHNEHHGDMRQSNGSQPAAPAAPAYQ